MKSEVIRVRNMISKTAAKYSEVKFYYSDALQAMRDVLGLRTQEIGLDIDMTKAGINAMIKINSQSDIFGPQPFLALKTKGGQYYWDNLDFRGKNEWSYVFDNNTLDIKNVEKIGVASNNASGVVEVVVYDVDKSTKEKKIMNLK
jgi:hypothetical protein